MPSTESQAAVIAHRDGPLIVLAGAGSGKTWTVCQRLARMVADRTCEPGEHLMLTFSRKATHEMRQRCAAQLAAESLPVAARDLSIDTYHAFGYRLVRDNPALAGRRDNPTLQDDADLKRTLKSLAAEMDLDYSQYRGRIKGWHHAYSLAKNTGLCARTPADHAALVRFFTRMEATQRDDPQQVLHFARAYEHRLWMTNTLDFDDLCLWPARALRDDPQLGEQYARRFPYITVDESQDTNLVQYHMVHGIARHHRRVVMVGDDDQSIYAWRGAMVANMRRFIDRYNPRRIRLEQNFRSTPALVRSAVAHIRHNPERLDKKPFASGDEGTAPEAQRHPTGYAMADRIAESIARDIDKGVPPNEIAVLYRTNRMARVVESGLRARGLPYSIVGGHSLYDTAEVKAAIAAVRIMVNGNDQAAFWQFLPHIPGLGKQSLERLIEIAEADPSGRLDLFGASGQVGGRMFAAFEWLDDRLGTLHEAGPTQVGDWMLSDSGAGYGRRLSERLANGSINQEEFDRRVGNLQALDRATEQALRIQRVDTDAPIARQAFERFRIVLEAQLSDGAPRDEADETPSVVLSTAHRAKGLEWRVVHVAGYSDGLMPLAARDDNPGHLSEERRLSYVAITRAQRACYLHHADALQFPGDAGPTRYEPSPFLDELGVDLPDARPGPAYKHSAPDFSV